MFRLPGFLAIVPLAALCSPAFADDAVDWNGFYAGVHGGYWMGAYTQQGDYSDPSTLPDTSNFGGIVGGGQVGYTLAPGGVVMGIEASVDWTNAGFVEAKNSGITNYRSGHLNWTGDLTAKLGVEVGSLMPYVLAGAAFANNTITVDGDVLGLTAPISGSGMHVGYVVGAGVAAQLADNISGFVELRYADYGVAQYDFGGGRIQPGALSGTSARIGLNFGM